MNADKLRAAAKAVEPAYIEDVFSTYLYTGKGSTQTITNGIDLSGKGGLVWLKGRSTAGQRNGFFDTQRGVSNFIWSDSIASQNTFAGYGVTGFGSSGFTAVDDSGGGYWVNGSGITYASWTFRKQAKFFDIVTYTGTGSNRTVSHNLGSVPGCIIVKRTDTTADWQVYHRSLANTEYMVLNSTAAKATGTTRWDSTTPTSTVFSLGTDTTVNASGGTYVAYLFAHDAGGFGLSGTDNVISCGSYTGNGSATGPVVTLGYEPQWLMIKNTSAGTYQNWVLLDVMRGLPVNGAGQRLYANVANSEASSNPYVNVLATGFQPASASSEINTSGNIYIYIAIRRGPMKVPTSGTSVFSPVKQLGGGFNNSGFVADFFINALYSITDAHAASSRLQGGKHMNVTSTQAEAATAYFKFDYNNGFEDDYNSSAQNSISYIFRRAPGFFDVVCYTGDAVAGRNVSHNLGAAPELVIVKRRNVADEWTVRAPSTTGELYLSRTNAQNVSFNYLGTTTSTTFNLLSGGTQVNGSGSTYVAYLFATVAGVSKVGSYTGSGTTKQIDCGFTAGARFVLIKKTSGTGSWYCWDAARGIVAGNDPYLLLNSTAAEVTNTDYIDTYSAGFEISSTAPSEINENGGTFIFLAIA